MHKIETMRRTAINCNLQTNIWDNVGQMREKS